MKIASLGECMVELFERPDGLLSRAFGGDTLNTALYLARLACDVDYVTALGDDAWSTEMLDAWKAEGIGTGAVTRLPGRVPGLYIIRTDARGERTFSYWRDSAPARDLFALPQTPEIAAALAAYDVIYFSGISLSLYGENGRARLMQILDTARARGARVVFDTNFRPRGWPDRVAAKAAYDAALDRADIAFASAEDLEMLYGPEGEARFLDRRDRSELVLKFAEPGCRVIAGGTDAVVPAPPVERVVDTTAAGDSFAAAYLAARLRGADPVASAEAGHRLAGTVVGYRGAIIPRDAMPG